ncbi:OTU domain-containing protein [Abeliophyllum distichum]|uniref:OTU domain-containing protein n=1 Tax=Abeliophyllum distichum TaxID=126358 RepID=A0ABD1URG4_9LAMI
MEAEKPRDLSPPIDVAFLDAPVEAFYCTGSKEEKTNCLKRSQKTHLTRSKKPLKRCFLGQERDNGSTEQGNCNEKGSKAEQNAKKKQVDEEISKLSTKLKERHAEELASLGYSSSGAGNGRGHLDNLIKAIARVFSHQSSCPFQNLARVSRGVRKDLNRKLPENKEYKKSRARL